ncbi:MAG: hypothetical protein QOI83_3747 [Streptomycetaceae bacterium]|nr:hypothetical protein [Streptomycetaceae bacterium]
MSRRILPEAVAKLRARIGTSDGLLIATPEYAHGPSGVLKNALERLVGAREIAAKPVALISASYTGGDRALTRLTETLAVMGANMLPHSLRIPQATRTVTDSRLTDKPTLAALQTLLDHLARADTVLNTATNRPPTPC